MGTQKRYGWLIALGILLMLVSIIGSITDFEGVFAKPEKSSYRYYSKTIQPLDIPPAQTTVQPGSEITQVTPDQVTDINYLRNDLFYIHTQTQKQLEFPFIPDRIEIPSIKLIAPVIVADFNFTDLNGETFGQWQAPSEFAAGWHPDSALLGEVGNTVINGHHNEYGEVFGKLVDVKEGDFVYVYSGDHKFSFVVSNRMILPERFVNAKTRLENARWLAKSDDIRLTLVTCWPYKSNTHRLILVASPIQ